MTRIHTFLEQEHGPVHVGEIFTTVRRNHLSSVFEYSNDYLEQPTAYSLEPGLWHGTSSHVVGSSLPRSVQDAAPDRWGRRLIERGALQSSSETGLRSRSLDDTDYLLGVSDETRQGALRFKLDFDGDFLKRNSDVPKLIELPRLLRATEQLIDSAGGSHEAVKFLLDAGTASLGGARPKASVREGADLFIAKFPRRDDDWNEMAWEATALTLAGQAGINTPEFELLHLESQSVLLLKRFDRERTQRIGYISAMTMTQKRDNENAYYLEIAEAVGSNASKPSEQLHELWRRIFFFFSVIINNTDDHLRNHGFLRHKDGWMLSPVFDVNPNPNSAVGRQTALNNATNGYAEFAELFNTLEWFGLDYAQAQKTAREVVDALREWEVVAKRHQITAEEIRRFQPMFEAGLAAAQPLVSS